MTKPKIVCLCGSTKFKKQYEIVTAKETLAGHIVLSCGLFGHADGITLTEEQKTLLDQLHLRKIDLADEVIVISVDNYIGSSTRNEIAYCKEHGKTIVYINFTDK